MIFYLLLTIPWMFLSSENAKRDSQHKRYISAWTRSVPQLTVFRRLPFYGFLATIPPMMWFYYRHSVLRIPGGMSSHRIFKTKLIRGKLSLHLLLNV